MKALVMILASSMVFLGQTDTKNDTYEAWKINREREKTILLRNLPPVFVRASLGENMDSTDLQRLKTAIEIRLRDRGIGVVEKPPYSAVFGCYVFWVGQPGWYTSEISVTLAEAATLNRTGQTVTHESWKSITNGRKTEAKEPTFEQAREWIMAGVDEFCNDYLAANPKQP